MTKTTTFLIVVLTALKDAVSFDVDIDLLSGLKNLESSFQEELNSTKLGELLVVRKCYKELGCFQNGYPFWSLRRPISLLPQSNDTIQTEYLLNTRENAAMDAYIMMSPWVKNVSYFDSKKKTKVIIHGYLEDGEFPWILDMASALLDDEDVNVIRVNWKNGARAVYHQSVANIRMVGAELALLIQRLCFWHQLRPGDVHIIGHSLGAHAAGYAGDKLKENKLTLGRITGLDPADPYFSGCHVKVRLDKGDAAFVDVIHSDATTDAFKLGFGILEPCGHADFYPNGGENQPGCHKDLLKAVKVGDPLWGVREFIGCNHRRAAYYFTESVRSRRNPKCRFHAKFAVNFSSFEAGVFARHSPSGAIMGIDADIAFRSRPTATNVAAATAADDDDDVHNDEYNDDGAVRERDKDVAVSGFFLKTRAVSPFCGRHVKIQVHIANGGEIRLGRLWIELTHTNDSSVIAEPKIEMSNSEKGVVMNPGDKIAKVVIPFLSTDFKMHDLRVILVRWENIFNPLLHYTWPNLIYAKTLRISQVSLWVQKARRKLQCICYTDDGMCINGALHLKANLGGKLGCRLV